MEFHKEHLLKCCRVCGRRLKTSTGKGRSFAYTRNSRLLLETFSIDVSPDHSDVHPQSTALVAREWFAGRLQQTRRGFHITPMPLITYFNGVHIGMNFVE